MAKKLSAEHALVIGKATEFRDQITNRKQTEYKISIFSSEKQSKSSRTRKASNFAFKYAEAQAAITNAEYAEKEAILKKEQALLEEQERIANASRARKMEELKTDLEVLSYKIAAAAAKAEMKALETMSQIDDDASSVRS
ncbi:hypothetical protein DPMN_114052 [Dreissena polymorpha]|uniref:Uncharacterized protein n=1 Tax=Dreissena polymorpha TaxID=45954 RepID=A0A9D4QSF6_DREPO|nr:hypothetical protein DPMN_114052 [Dreissena polymorpha]